MRTQQVSCAWKMVCGSTIAHLHQTDNISCHHCFINLVRSKKKLSSLAFMLEARYWGFCSNCHCRNGQGTSSRLPSCNVASTSPRSMRSSCRRSTSPPHNSWTTSLTRWRAKGPVGTRRCWFSCIRSRHVTSLGHQWANSFLRGSSIFWTMSNSCNLCPTHFSREIPSHPGYGPDSKWSYFGFHSKAKIEKHVHFL